MVHLDYRDARPIYAQITEGFRQKILLGILQPGDKMPSVRELAMELSINPNTIQRAYRELESEGWIVSVAGKGSFVCDRVQPDSTGTLLADFDELVRQLLQRGVTPDQLQERLKQGGDHNA